MLSHCKLEWWADESYRCRQSRAQKCPRHWQISHEYYRCVQMAEIFIKCVKYTQMILLCLPKFLVAELQILSIRNTSDLQECIIRKRKRKEVEEHVLYILAIAHIWFLSCSFCSDLFLRGWYFECSIAGFINLFKRIYS